MKKLIYILLAAFLLSIPASLRAASTSDGSGAKLEQTAAHGKKAKRQAKKHKKENKKEKKHRQQDRARKA